MVKKFDPDFNTVLESQAKAIKYDMFCHRIGKISKWNPTTLTADIELLEKKKNINGSTVSYPLLQDVPVVIYRGANCGLTLGDITGCNVLVHFNDRDIDNWFATNQAMLPNSERLHSISDCFAELQLFSQLNGITYDNTGVVLENDAMKLKLTGGDNPEITLTNGNWTLSIVGDKATITGKMDITGAVKITGDVDVTGNVTASGTVTGSDCQTSGGISLQNHIHSVPTAMPATPGVPVVTEAPTP